MSKLPEHSVDRSLSLPPVPAEENTNDVLFPDVNISENVPNSYRIYIDLNQPGTK